LLLCRLLAVISSGRAVWRAGYCRDLFDPPRRFGRNMCGYMSVSIPIHTSGRVWRLVVVAACLCGCLVGVWPSSALVCRAGRPLRTRNLGMRVTHHEGIGCTPHMSIHTAGSWWGVVPVLLAT
jgi:hypothetical protein